MRSTRRALLAGALLTSFVAASPSTSAQAVAPPDAPVFISELHYDNEGTDAGEAVEIFGPTCTDLTDWSVVFYNGNGGGSYATAGLSGFIGGTGYGTVVVNQAGIQNGSPDGLALVDDGGTVRQFLSYEGAFTAADGPAAGLASTDIGVAESGATPIGDSLQLTGSGSVYGDFTWDSGASNFGELGGIEPTGVGGDPSSCDGGGGDPAELVINEIHYDNVGTDTGEAIEVAGPAGTDLSGWQLVRYNGSNGLQYGQDTLSGTLPDLGGGVGVAVVTYPSNGLQNGAPDGVALVDPTGAVAEFLSYEGTLTANDGPAAGLTSTDIGVEEGSSTADDQSLQRAADGSWFGPVCNSFGLLNDEGAPEECPGGPVTPVFIHEIQGSGSASPLEGQTVLVEAVVTGAPDADPDGVYETFGGFYLQEEDADADLDPLTSEGIFVFASGDVTVGVGDLVQVVGVVDEFSGLTELTDLTSVDVVGTAPLPTATAVTFPVVSDFDFEPLEGMLLTLPQEMVVSEYFNYDRFGEVVVALPTDGTDRPMTPTAVYDEDSPEAAELADLNARSRITIDDGLSSQNPNEPVHPFNRELFSLTNAFRGGDTVTGLTGPLHFAFGYKLMPLANGDGFETWTQTIAPDVPDDVGGDLKVASLNALNYFLTLDDGVNDICGPDLDQECRGADDANEFERQRVKLLNTLEGLDADVIGLNELENTTGVEALADLAAGLNDRLGAGTYDYIAAGTDGAVGGDAIKVGLLYRPAAVTPYGDPAVLDTPEFIDPNNTGSPRNRAAVAQTFVENASGEVFSVVVNHLKSKGSSCGAGDDHPLAGSCNVTRTLAAQVLADWIDTDPTGVPDDDWLIIGDLNSYDQEDPITALGDAGYTDLIGQFQGDFAYSYVFDGQFGYLDYLMSSSSMTAQVTGATEWHINADEPDIFDYDTSFKSDYQDSLFDPTTPFRSSDHDAAILGLTLAGLSADVEADPAMLWPPNHKLRDIGFVASVEPDGDAEIVVLGATSSEADSGLGIGDVPNDIVLTDGELQLRAERFSIDGRTYTVTVEVRSGGQVVIVDGIEVVVNHDQRNKKKMR